MLKKLSLAAIVSLCALTSLPAMAENKPAGTGPNPFSDCGIGAALFPNTHWAAVTSNVIWDLGTTALTSATLSPHTCNGKDMAAARFIGETYARLAEETARGEGEHLATVLDILECSPARQPAAIERTRSYMLNNVMSSGYESRSDLEKASNYYDSVKSAVNESCTA